MVYRRAPSTTAATRTVVPSPRPDPTVDGHFTRRRRRYDRCLSLVGSYVAAIDHEHPVRTAIPEGRQRLAGRSSTERSRTRACLSARKVPVILSATRCQVGNPLPAGATDASGAGAIDTACSMRWLRSLVLLFLPSCHEVEKHSAANATTTTARQPQEAQRAPHASTVPRCPHPWRGDLRHYGAAVVAQVGLSPGQQWNGRLDLLAGGAKSSCVP